MSAAHIAGESAHALAGALQVGGELEPGALLLVNLSGRGDKDVDIAARWFGHVEEGHVEHGENAR